MRVDKYGALENSTYVTNLLVDDFNISMETTGGDVSWINGMNEIHKKNIHNMVRAALIDIHQHEKNCAVQQIIHQKYTYENSTVH